MSDLFTTLARKHSNFSGVFSRSNLSGVVERIAKGLACDSAYARGCTTVELLSNLPLRIHALSTHFSPVSANCETVFVPRLVDDILTPDVFSVLAHAICGEGGIVSTDLVEVDPSTREPKITVVDNEAFAPACVDALRVLGANMNECGQGELFALAVVRGLNSVLSVVGHTDEGGVIRDILRCGTVGTPFGGIHYGLSAYAGLPALATSDGATVAGYCDSLLLSAAALVAHCDPGIMYNGSWFPTVTFGAGGADPELDAGAHQDGSRDHGPFNKHQMLANFTLFSRTYTQGLAKLFGVHAGGDSAHTFLSACAGQVDSHSRHFCHASMAPYFWIEPTSLIPHDFLGSISEIEGFASVCSRHVFRERAAWEEVVPTGVSDGLSSEFVVRFRGARAAPFLHHFNGHGNDGLAYVVPRQLDTAGVIHPGPGAAGPLTTRLKRSNHIGQYLWTRGQTPLCAPGEFLNLGETMLIRVSHFTMDADGFPNPHHTPAAHEFAGLTIKFSVSAPVGIEKGGLTEHTRDARRARTIAARSLAAANVKMRMYGQAAITSAPILFSAPPLLRGRNNLQTVGPLSTEVRKPLTEAYNSAQGAHARNDDDIARAVPVAAVMKNEVVSGPTVGITRDTGPAGLSAADRGGMAAPVDDAISATSGVGARPAPTTTSSGVAPPQRADSG